MKFYLAIIAAVSSVAFVFLGAAPAFAKARRPEDREASAGSQVTRVTVKGRVCDPQSRAVPRAAVTIRPLPSGPAKTVRTNVHGAFDLTSLFPGQYRIQVAAPGFQIARIQRRIETSIPNLTVQLRVKPVGEPIQVTSSIPEMNTEQRVSGTTLAETQTQDVAQGLRYLPGVSAIRRGPINLDPSIRGLQANEVPAFVNGAHTFAVGPARMDSGISHVSPHDVQDVRIVKGHYALTWGPGTMSAVQIETFQPPFFNQFRVHGKVGFNYGTNAGTADPYVSLWGGDDRLSVGLFHNTRTGGDYHAGNGATIPGHYEVNDNGWNLGWRPSENTTFRYSGGFEEDNNVEYPGRLLNAKYFLVRTNNFTFHWHPESGSVSEVFGQFYIDRLGHLMNNNGKPTAFPMPGRTPPFALNVELPAHSDTVGGAFHISLGRSAWNAELGTDFYHLGQNADRSVSQLDTGELLFSDIVWPQAVQNDEGGYGQLLFRGEHVQLGGTIRLDGVQTSARQVSSFFLAYAAGPLNNNEVNFSAALSANFRVTDHWSLYAGAGRAVSSPTILERYSDRFPSTEFQISAEFMGNPSLLPEQSLEFDLGSSARFKGFDLDVALFQRHIDNYVTIAPDPSIPRRLPLDPTLVYRYINGSARFYGGDASIRKAFGRYVDGSAAVSYTWAKDLKLNEPVIGISPLRGKIGLTLHPASARMGIQAQSILADHQNRVATSRYELPTAGYAIFNLGGFYRISPPWTLRAGVDNLLNRYYWDHLDAMDPYTHLPIPEMGRNVRAGFEYSF
jgi:iron complex outermembrane recepter protein